MADHAHRIQHFRGSPRDIGIAKGQAMGAALDRQITRYIEEFGDADDKFTIDTVRLHQGALPWLHTLPQRFQEELAGIAEGAGIPLQRVAEWYFIEQCAALRCSGALLTLNGHTWVARNNDSVAPGLWGYVGIREVDNRIPTVTFGCEGDVFVPTGINKEKLWLHYNYLPTPDRLDTTRAHLPPYVFMMDALETCRTLRDIELRLHEIQRSDGMLLFAVDGKSDEFAIFECGHGIHYRRGPTNNVLVGTNHFCMRDDPDGPLEATPLGTLGRFRRVETLLKPICSRSGGCRLPAELIQLLADDEVERRGDTFATVEAAVACPYTGDIWYTFGGFPAASNGNWQRLEWPW